MKMINFLSMKKNKRNCTLCNGETNNLFTIKMPVFMGVNKDNIEESITDMSFNVCDFCGEVQINELLDLNIIYHNNHNINIIGNIWEQHYIKFSEFIKDTIKNKTILEISDPSAKIAKLSQGFKKWYIIEPNSEKINLPNVEFINDFFDENFNTLNNVDVIIHSHLLEHIHNPMLFFNKCNEILTKDGVMLISIPDMDYILSKNYLPNNILHFEHTYFLNSKILEMFSNHSGFKIIETFKYDNHSIFYKLKKDSSIIKKPIKLEISNKFKTNYENCVDNINNINRELLNYNDHSVYIFGAHVSSQFYLFNGLDKTKIKHIIDNDVNKQNHRLYGTELYVKNPDIINCEKKCVVICSHIGIYYNEIVKQLTNINKNIIIL